MVGRRASSSGRSRAYTPPPTVDGDGTGAMPPYQQPYQGGPGTLPPQPGYLEALRELCDACGALLVFDEVISGFRAAAGGAQQVFGVKPDLTCLGKIIGGGLPVGAYGGRADVMELVAPAGPVRMVASRTPERRGRRKGRGCVR